MKISIFGLGYVGRLHLPFLKNEYKVYGIDISKISNLNKGTSVIKEPG